MEHARKLGYGKDTDERIAAVVDQLEPDKLDGFVLSEDLGPLDEGLVVFHVVTTRERGKMSIHKRTEGEIVR